MRAQLALLRPMLCAGGRNGGDHQRALPPARPPAKPQGKAQPPRKKGGK